jgi:NitT/TauT family transport system substrate-binding protein
MDFRAFSEQSGVHAVTVNYKKEESMKTLLVRVLSVLLGLIMSPLVLAQEKPEKDRIRIGYAAQAAAHSIPYLAKEAGFFSEEGLQVEVVRTAGAIAPMALLSGDVDFSIMSAFLMISAAIKEKDLVMLAGLTRYASMSFVSRSEIRSAEGLRGKVVGLQRPGDAYEMNARFALRHLGLEPNKDVKFLFLGSNEVIWPALEGKRVDAAVITPPATLWARKARMNFLVELADLKIEYQGSTLTTRRVLLRDNRNVTRKVVRAMVRGIHFFKTGREKTQAILSRFLGTKDREALEETWRYLADMPAKPYAVESAVQGVLNHLSERDARFTQHRPTEFIDNGPLSEVERSGFIDRLYQVAK